LKNKKARVEASHDGNDKRRAAEVGGSDGNYIALDLTGTPRLVMKDSKDQEICTVPQAHFGSVS
jgi:hypothetical protein